MSLIQQALKRKMDEQQGKAPPPPPPLPPSQFSAAPQISTRPPPIAPAQPAQAFDPEAPHRRIGLVHGSEQAPPPPGQPPSAGRGAPLSPSPQPLPPAPDATVAEEEDGAGRKKAGLRLAIVFGGLLIVCGVAFYLLWSSGNPAIVALVKRLQAAPQPAHAAAAPATDRTNGVTGGSITPMMPLPNIPAIKAKVGNMKEAVAESRKDNVEIEAGVVTPPAPAAPATQVAQPAPAPPVQPAPPAIPQPAPVAAVEQTGQPPALSSNPSVVWPAVRISGVMPKSTKGQQSAIINDALITVGESVDGMTLVEVRDNGVMLELKGDHRFFPVGRRR